MRLILLALFLQFIRHGVIFPFLPLMAGKMGAGPSTIGYIVGAFSLTGVFLSIPLGGLIDRFGVKKLLIVAVTCNILSAVIFLKADTISALIAAQFISGVAFLLHVIASQAFVSRLADAYQREKGFSWIGFCGAAGHSGGPILGGILVERFNYQAAFWVVLALSVCGLIIFALKNDTGPNCRGSLFNPIQDIQQAYRLSIDSKVSFILVFAFVVFFAANLQTSFLPILLRSEGLSEFVVGMLISLFAVMSTSVRLLFIKLLTMYHRKTLITCSMLAIIFAVALIPLMTSVLGFSILISVFGIGFGMTQPISMIMLSDSTNPNHSGLAMGLRSTAMMLAGLLSPIFLGFIVESIGMDSAFYAAALVVFSGFWLLCIRPEFIPDRRV